MSEETILGARGGASKALVTSILSHLGYNSPSDGELQDAIRLALADLKTQNGQDPDRVKYKVVVPIDIEWIKQFN
jgi:hypothetical protein